MRYAWEYTDTFAGYANYGWVKRGEFSARDDREAFRKAKAAAGLTGVRGIKDSWTDTIEFRPWRRCTVLFVSCLGEKG